jgi:hypothetical protein
MASISGGLLPTSDDRPYLEGYAWVLSNRHEIPDKCNGWAAASPYPTAAQLPPRSSALFMPSLGSRHVPAGNQATDCQREPGLNLSIISAIAHPEANIRLAADSRTYLI